MLKPKSSSWKSILLYSAIGSGLATTLACSTGPGTVRTPSSTASADEAQAPAAPPIPKTIDVADMKNGQGGRPSVDPCDDFYQYSCGAWIDKAVIPADKSGVVRRFTAASDAVDIVLNHILAAYSRGDFSIPSKYASKLSDYYNSCLTVDQQTPQALVLVKKEIANIRAAKPGAERARLLARLNFMGANPLFGFGSGKDPADSTKVIGMISQAGLGLPNRDYYFNKDAKSVETREKYRAFVSQIFTLLGETPVHAEAIAKQIYDLEEKLAIKAYPTVDLQDISKTNHPMNQAGLRKLAPHFDWKTYIAASGVGSLNDLNIRTPEFIAAADKIVQATSKDVLANYFILEFVRAISTEMGGDFSTAKFDFYGKTLSGTKERAPLWKRCTEATSKDLDYALLDAYVQTFDGTKIRDRADLLIAEIKKSFAENLGNLKQGPDGWLDDDAIKGALLKLDKISKKVGAPTKVPDYMPIKTAANSFLQNYLNVSDFQNRRDFAKIGKPVDKSEWFMMPWTINAYYDPSSNEFVFPFGILQPPSFDVNANDGVNYGAFGAIVGHELTHGFDAAGSKYDADGNLKDWWNASTTARFKERTECFVNQANDYHIDATNMNVNGKLTINENLADQGGVKLGYLTLDKILAKRAMAPEWNGYNERQQYWIAFSQGWCGKLTDEAARHQMMTNEHPIYEFRVNQVLRNRPEFARDFNCKAGSRMAPVKRCSLW